MAEREPESPESPDVRTVRQLVRLMHKFELTAIDLTNERTTIRLRRSSGVVAAPAAPAAAAAAPVAPAAPAAPSASAPAAKPGAEAVYIRSPMVGTFYESPAPDASPYVGVGSTVRPDTTVCLIEAMKVFTEINSGVSGTIAEVLIKSGQAVEYDQPLFRVEPS
jgi:acetyl-CoA carboxylase biotin carboxyl carrier protein